MANLNDHLKYGTTTLKNRLSKEMQEFVSYYMSAMIDEGLLSSLRMDSSDETYQAYINGKISVSEFLAYSINKQWVDLDMLGITGDYYSTEEIYEVLVDTTFDLLYDNKEFDLKIYRELIFNYKLSGREICPLLFDQNVIEYKEDVVNNLKRGRISAYDFLMEKIRNIEITPAQLALAPCSGTVVQADANTGAVIALVSYPSYDSNRLTNKIEWSYYSAHLANLLHLVS